MPIRLPIHTTAINTPPDGIYSVATEDELLNFANEVRQAGGADIIPALLPSMPNAPSQCLIAKALNFECNVDGIDEAWPSGAGKWAMRPGLSAPEAVRVAEKLGLEYRKLVPDDYGYAEQYIVLPEHIGNAALAFDRGAAFTKFNLMGQARSTW